jgi:hypothetical protein
VLSVARCVVSNDWVPVSFVIPFYLQSVPVHSPNCVKTYTVACRRGSRPLVAFGN